MPATSVSGRPSISSVGTLPFRIEREIGGLALLALAEGQRTALERGAHFVQPDMGRHRA